MELIGHFKRISLLEQDLEKQIGKTALVPRISIALNRDSLETWFSELVKNTDLFKNISLEIIADDQELTLDYLKKGVVSASLSTSEKEIQGGRVHFLGKMEYVLVASPSFIKKYFSKGNLKENLIQAPAIKFDQNDRLHERYLEKFFNLDGRNLNYHIVPSVAGFRQFALMGYGYALIPQIDILADLKEKRLLPLSNKVWQIPLYWHYWAIESKLYQNFNADLIQHAIHQLKSKDSLFTFS